jgi:hypothetical protein
VKLDHDEVPTDPCDDTVLMRTIVHWVGSNIEATTSPKGSRPCGHIARARDGAWRLAFAVQRGEKRQVHFIDVDPMGTRADRWPIYQLGPGVWDLSKSVHAEGQYHGFVTVVGVPDPAPWEKGEIVIASKEPTPDELVMFAKTWLERTAGAMPFTRTSLGLAIYRRPNIAFLAVNETVEASAEFRAGLVDHLTRKVRPS